MGAFTNTDVYSDGIFAKAAAEAAQTPGVGLSQLQQQQRAASGSGASTSGDSLWQWPGTSHRPKRSLVGFARAAGDSSLVRVGYASRGCLGLACHSCVAVILIYACSGM